MHRVVPEKPVDKRNTLGLPPPSSPMLGRTVRLFRPYRIQVVSVAFLILLTASIGVINPLLIRTVFDDGLFPASGGPDMELLWILAAIMSSIAIANGLMGVLQTYMTAAEIDFMPVLPKTRSGKIMRRLLKANELGIDPGDITTLEE